MMTKRTTALAAAALAAAAAAAAVLDGITLERYPDADMVVVDSRTQTVYQEDGTYVSTEEEWIKALTERGRRDLSTISMRYSLRYGRGEIVSVEIIGEDGAARAVDFAQTLKEATANSSNSVNIYDRMDKTLSCSVPGLKVGETRHVVTRRTMTKSRVRDQWSDIEVLEMTEPVVRASVTIDAPVSRPLRRVAVRNPIGNVTSSVVTNADRIVYSWTAENSPKAFPEPSSPPTYTLLEGIRASTVGDWPELSRWYWNLTVPHLGKTTEAISNQVESIGRDVPSLYRWVAQEVRYMGLTLEDSAPGYEPHDVDVTFDNRYGVCRDKAALLVAMLRVAGFEAFPVLIHTEAKMDPEVPCPYFNHAIVAVRAPGDPAANADGFILMDPTDESSRDLFPAYLSNCSYLVATPEGEPLHTSQTPPASDNAFRVSSRGTLAADGSLVMESAVSFAGIDDNGFRHALLRRTPENRRRLFESIARAAAPGAELMLLEIEPADLRDTARRLGAKLIYRVPDAVISGDTRVEFAVPMISRVIGTANGIFRDGVSLAKRRFPLVVDATALCEETAEIEIGDALGAPLVLPGEIEMEGAYEYARSYRMEGGRLVAKRRLASNALEFQPDEYLELRERLSRVEVAEREKPVFAKSGTADADVRILLNRRDVALASPYAWTVTNTVVKEILTYNGKKSSAELKFNYNPLVENVEILHATVSNADGRVVSAGAHEINEFDCSWAASAPRYPASRQIVASLPSVEIGSVISCSYVRTVTDSPAPFRGVWYFDTREPADELTVNFSDAQTGERRSRTVLGPERVPRERMQPSDILWRDCEMVSRGDLRSAAKRLSAAADVAALREGEAYEAGAAAAGPEGKAEAVRNWMSRHVIVAGPSLYEVPLAAQLTDPATVMRERYATRLDYVRAMCAVLKGLGLRADIVFAAHDAGADERITRIALSECPDPAMFSAALCRVRVRRGGFLWWGGRTDTYYIGTENEYTPFGATPSEDCHFLDPADGSVGVVAPSEPGLHSLGRTVAEIEIDGGGAARVTVTSLRWGPAVGAFRRKYSEMLPEERRREHEGMVSSVSQGAVADGELETDLHSYPARSSFSVRAPGYATVAGGAVTVTLPLFAENLFPVEGSVRRSPLAESGKDRSVEEARVVFPEGYDEIEHLPESYTFCNPGPAGEEWYSFSVSTERDGRGRLCVVLSRETASHGSTSVGRDYAALLREWNRIGSCRSNRTIVVRRAEGAEKEKE